MAKKSVSADDLLAGLNGNGPKKAGKPQPKRRAMKKKEPKPKTEKKTAKPLLLIPHIRKGNQKTASQSPPAESKESAPINQSSTWEPSENFPSVTEHQIGLAAARGVPMVEIMLSSDLNPDRYSIPQLERIVTACREHYRKIHGRPGMVQQRRLDDCQQIEWMIQNLMDGYVRSGAEKVETIVDSDGNKTEKRSQMLPDPKYLKTAMDAMDLKHRIEAEIQKTRPEEGVTSLGSRGLTPRQLRLMHLRLIERLDENEPG